MTTKYARIKDGIEARIHNGYLFVRSTDISGDFLIEGGRAGRVCKMPYTGTLEDAKTIGTYNDPFMTDIQACIDRGIIVRCGRVIQ
jgi:hypothetical protein